MSAEVIAQFSAALSVRGIVPGDIVADGTLQRCATEGGKAGRKDACYILHLDSFPAGGFENHRDGHGWENWRCHGADPLTPEMAVEHRRRAEADRQAREADRLERQRAAATKAARLWRTAPPATNAHPYLIAKGVAAYGIRRLRDQLVIPLRDTSATLWSLQFIGPTGTKRFLTGGRKRGCYCAIGNVGDVLCVCEGYATGASIYAATGHAVAVALDAGNLEPVARALREKFPALRLVICADNDLETPGNPGVTSAAAAARTVNGLLAVPSFAVEGA